jgi:acyl transferase domain-containing protein
VPGQVVLVLQGGGALGAYQAGVYEALHQSGIEPDWVIGTSIGAINAAVIAGNPPERPRPPEHVLAARPAPPCDSRSGAVVDHAAWVESRVRVRAEPRSRIRREAIHAAPARAEPPVAPGVDGFAGRTR